MRCGDLHELTLSGQRLWPRASSVHTRLRCSERTVTTATVAPAKKATAAAGAEKPLQEIGKRSSTHMLARTVLLCADGV